MSTLAQYPWLSWYVSRMRPIPGFCVPRSWGFWKESSFSIGATPVTWGMWKEYCKAITMPGNDVVLPLDPGWGYQDDHPVVNVSWHDIMDTGGFCDWASYVSGQKITLPSVVQWEYAARGGKHGQYYPWGNEFDASLLWSDENMTASVDRTDRIHRNAFGLTDMVGNVWEWSSDYYDDDCKARCVLGGSWFNFERGRSRFKVNPAKRNCNVGFRFSVGQT